MTKLTISSGEGGRFWITTLDGQIISEIESGTIAEQHLHSAERRSIELEMRANTASHSWFDN